jgi:hypothetical protein
MADNEEWFYHEKTVAGGVTGDPVIGNDVADG